MSFLAGAVLQCLEAFRYNSNPCAPLTIQVNPRVDWVAGVIWLLIRTAISLKTSASKKILRGSCCFVARFARFFIRSFSFKNCRTRDGNDTGSQLSKLLERCFGFRWLGFWHVVNVIPSSRRATNGKASVAVRGTASIRERWNRVGLHKSDSDWFFRDALKHQNQDGKYSGQYQRVENAEKGIHARNLSRVSCEAGDRNDLVCFNKIDNGINRRRKFYLAYFRVALCFCYLAFPQRGQGFNNAIESVPNFSRWKVTSNLSLLSTESFNSLREVFAQSSWIRSYNHHSPFGHKPEKVPFSVISCTLRRTPLFGFIALGGNPIFSKPNNSTPHGSPDRAVNKNLCRIKLYQLVAWVIAHSLVVWFLVSGAYSSGYKRGSKLNPSQNQDHSGASAFPTALSVLEDHHRPSCR